MIQAVDLYHAPCWRGHMEKQETEMKRKLEMETGNGNWKWKLETEMQTKDAPITGEILSS